MHGGRRFAALFQQHARSSDRSAQRFDKSSSTDKLDVYQLPEYDEIKEQLSGAGMKTGPAEAHAFISGLICGDFETSLQLMQQELFGDSDAHEPQVQECKGALLQMHAEIREQLEDPVMGFRLMLPHDDVRSDERAQQLVNWCQGFLFGFGISVRDNERNVSDVAQESLTDISEFTRLDVDSIDADDEEQRQQMTELEEYLRVAVMTIYEDVPDDSG
jgi:yecA family protein